MTSSTFKHHNKTSAPQPRRTSDQLKLRNEMDLEEEHRLQIKDSSDDDKIVDIRHDRRVSAETIRRLKHLDLEKELSRIVHGKGFSVAAQHLLAGLCNYARSHPILFGLQVAGLAVGTIAILALPILGALGFSAVGPVAGSAAAAWQASMGLVEAGTIFAWCQSAAMGGAAVGGIVAAGLSGFGVVVAPVILGAKEGLARFFRKGDTGVKL